MMGTQTRQDFARFALVTVMAATGSLAAQSPRSPSFKAAVDAVQLDVRVAAADGAFVRGLTKDDFRVVEDGREQTVTAFSMVEVATTATTAAAASSADVSSNTSFRGRVYMLVLDDLHIHPLREVTVRDLARRFIEQYTTPADLVALATTSGVDSGAQEFTNNRQQLLEAIARFKARVLPETIDTDMAAFAMARAEAPPDAPAPVTADRGEVLPLLSLLSSVEFLGTVADRRKSLVFIGEGVPDRSGNPDVEGTRLEIVAAAARTNVAIYSVDAHGLPTAPSGFVKPVAVVGDDPISEGRQRLKAGLELLAEDTGGASVIASNAFDSFFERIVADSSTYYLLGYTSTNPPSQKLRKLDVRVTRPGLTVQVRRGHGTPSTRIKKRAAPPAGLPPALGEAFQSPVPFTDIELAVTTSPLRGSGNRASVAIVVEGRGDRPLDLFLAAAPANGKIEGFKRGVLKPAAGERGVAMMQTTAKLDLKPGRYHLRVAALREDTGARGSVSHVFDVPDFSKADLSISGLAFVDLRRGRAPTTRRMFAPGEAIDISAEVYWKRGMTQPVIVATTVANDRGEEVFRKEGGVNPAERPGLGVDFGVTIDLARWAPGVYRLVVEAATTGGKPLAAKRELTFTVSDR